MRRVLATILAAAVLLAVARVGADGEDERELVRGFVEDAGDASIEAAAPAREELLALEDGRGHQEHERQPRDSDQDPAIAPLPRATPWTRTGWVGLALGAAALLVAGGVDVAVLGSKSDAYQAAADRGELGARELRHEYVSLRVDVLVMYAVGATLALGGAGLVVFGAAPGAGATSAMH